MGSILRRATTKLGQLLSLASSPPPSAPAAGTIALNSQQGELYANGPATTSINSAAFGKIVGNNAKIPKGYIVGMAVERINGTTSTARPGICRSDDDTHTLSLGSAPNINGANIGVANGLDAGALAANTLYAVWIIGDSTGVIAGAAGLMSTSFTAPTLPAGYNKKRLVGAIQTSVGAATFPANGLTPRHAGQLGSSFTTTNGMRTRRVYRDTSSADTPLILTSGQATVFTDVSLASQVPPGVRNVVLEARFAPGTLGALTDVLSLRPDGAVSADGPWRMRAGVILSATEASMIIEMPCSAAQVIEYMVTQGGADQNTASLRVVAFDIEV